MSAEREQQEICVYLMMYALGLNHSIPLSAWAYGASCRLTTRCMDADRWDTTVRNAIIKLTAAVTVMYLFVDLFNKGSL